MILKHATGLSDADLIANESVSLPPAQAEAAEVMIAERLQGRPLSKILGVKEFYGRDFIVNDDVLDPRPESELIIDLVKPCAGMTKTPSILDLGTGSGCLILSVLAEIPQASGAGVDLSDKALVIAGQNAERLQLENRVSFVQSDWFQSVDKSFDIIIANPPYIETDVIPDLQKEVKNHDPHMALDGGASGLDPYYRIIPQAVEHLNPQGFLVVEHGAGQSQKIMEILNQHGFRDIRSHHDLAGHDRVITALSPL